MFTTSRERMSLPQQYLLDNIVLNYFRARGGKNINCELQERTYTEGC